MEKISAQGDFSVDNPHNLTKYLTATEHEECQVIDSMHLRPNFGVVFVYSAGCHCGFWPEAECVRVSIKFANSAAQHKA